MDAKTLCKGCSATVRLAPGEVQRLLAATLAGQKLPLAGDDVYARRLSVCGQCPDLKYGTTCRHCGCLVAVRAKLAGKACPAPSPRWTAESVV